MRHRVRLTFVTAERGWHQEDRKKPLQQAIVNAVAGQSSHWLWLNAADHRYGQVFYQRRPTLDPINGMNPSIERLQPKARSFAAPRLPEYLSIAPNQPVNSSCRQSTPSGLSFRTS